MFSGEFFLSLFVYFLVFLVAAILTCYAYFQYSYTYWSRKGVPFLKPKFPIGNNDDIGREAANYGHEVIRWYKDLKRKGHKFGGAWVWARPVLVLTDPEYIKDVFVKDFQYFVDRDLYHNPKDDPASESVLVLHGEEWKNTRQKLTPTFTSARIKMMFSSIVQCSDSLVEAIGVVAGTGGDINIKELIMSFTIDVIGSTAFGLEAKSFAKESSEFKKIAMSLLDIGIFGSLQLITARVSGHLARMLGIKTNPKPITKFFTDVLQKTTEYRRKNNIKRPDLLQLLMELQDNTKNDKKPFSFNEIVANAVTFYFAGFETSSATTTMALYELARNPEIQEKTRKEIREVIKKHNGEITYEAVQEMTYVRQVIDEALRLYPPVPVTARVAVKPYKFKNTDFTLEKGVSVLIPIKALAKDPEYFPDPEKFDPDRFSAENKGTRNSYVSVPFGEGPRNCIGMRFGIVQASIGLIRILDNFRITISPSTKIPITFRSVVLILQPNETLYVKAEKLK